MASLRSLIYAAIFYPLTVVWVLVGVVAAAFGSAAARAVAHSWTRMHHLLAQAIVGIGTRVEGQLPAGPVLIAVKHQSMYETLEIVRIADTPTIVIKRELLRIPLFGWLVRRYGAISVDRAAGAKALRAMMEQGKAAIAAGRPIIIYPEGTRVKVGETPPLRSGFAGLYRALGLPVVPVAVDSGRVWGKNLPRRTGTVRFLIGETIPAGLKRDEIEARVHAAINALERSGRPSLVD